jgi:hypothetical protein
MVRGSWRWYWARARERSFRWRVRAHLRRRSLFPARALWLRSTQRPGRRSCRGPHRRCRFPRRRGLHRIGYAISRSCNSVSYLCFCCTVVGSEGVWVGVRLVIMVGASDTSSAWLAQPDSLALAGTHSSLHHVRFGGGVCQ